MKAWLLSDFTGLDALKLSDVPDPIAQSGGGGGGGGGELRLRTRYAALNPADRYLAQGQYPAKPPLPHILGRDAVGVVDQVGDGVEGWNVGDVGVLLRGEVGVSRPGTLAERVIAPASYVVKLPPGWTEQQAAGAPLVYLTAYQALMQWGEPKPSAVVLVTGASGGVGIATIQLARAMGLRPLGLSSGADRRGAIKNLGAEEAFDPTDDNFPTRIKEYLKTDRVDLVVDNVAGPAFAGVIATLGDRGKVSVVGRQGGEVPSFNTGTLFFRRLRIGGVAVGAYTNDEACKTWDEIVRLLEKTSARPVIDRIFPFADLIPAFERLWSDHLGKVLIAVDSAAPLNG